MGWNDSRISLLSPGWRMVSEENSSNASTASGMPLRILHPERASEGCSAIINPEVLEGWLKEYGFGVRRRSPYGSRLQSEDVEVFLGIMDGVLAEVILTFTLTRDSPLRLDTWELFVKQLCESWGLRIHDSDLGFTVEANQFRRMLASTSAWQDFSEKFRWLPIRERLDSTSVWSEQENDGTPKRGQANNDE